MPTEIIVRVAAIRYFNGMCSSIAVFILMPKSVTCERFTEGVKL